MMRPGFDSFVRKD